MYKYCTSIVNGRKEGATRGCRRGTPFCTTAPKRRPAKSLVVTLTWDANEESVGLSKSLQPLGSGEFLHGSSSKQELRAFRQPLELIQGRVAISCDRDDSRIPRRRSEPQVAVVEAEAEVKVVGRRGGGGGGRSSHATHDTIQQKSRL